MGWMSPMTLLLQSKNSPKGVPLTDTEVGWIASIAYLSAALACYFMPLIVDKIGRKLTLIFVSLIGTMSWILMLSSLSIWAIIIARAFVGVTMLGSYIVCPAYTKEISSDSTRGAMGCLTVVFHTLGNLFLFVVGDLLEYHTVLWICLAIPILHVILFTTMPESPSFLLKLGKTKEATEVLLWLRCKKNCDTSIQEELDRIMSEQNNDELTKNSGFNAIRNDKILNKAFIIILMIVLARDLCGAIIFLNFAGEIFSISSEGTGIVLTPNQQAMVLGSVQVIAAIVATTLVEKTGRKFLLSGTACLSGISMVVLASWFLAKEFQVVFSPWIPVITLCICIFCDAAGLLPVSSILGNELFSFKYRSTVSAITLGVSALIDFLQIILFKPFMKQIGIYMIFYLFGVICLATALYVVIVLPETKGRSLEDIYQDLDRNKKNRCSAL